MNYAFAVPLILLFVTPLYLYGRANRESAINQHLNMFMVPMPFAACTFTLLLVNAKYIECMTVFLVAAISTSVSIIKIDSRINATVPQYVRPIAAGILIGAAWGIATAVLQKFF